MKNGIVKKIKEIFGTDSFSWTVLFWLCHFIILLWLYNTNNLVTAENDEFGFNKFFTGMYGEYIPSDGFENIVFGYIMCFLYKYFPICNWLILTYLLAYFFSYNAIMHVFSLKIKNGALTFLISMGVILLTYPYIYKQINFTSVGGVCGLAGMLLWVNALTEEDKNKIWKYMYGTMLLIFGFLVRRGSLEWALAYGVVFAFGMIRDGKIKRCRFWVLIVPASVLLLLYGVNRSYYGTPEWTQWRARNSLRGYINDYSSFRFGGDRYNAGSEEDEAYWSGVEMDRSDVRFLTSWYCGDDNVFTKEALEKLVDYDKAHQYEIKKIIRIGINAVLSYLYILLKEGLADFFIIAFIGLVCMICTAYLTPFRIPEILMIYFLTDMEICAFLYKDRLVPRAVIIPLMSALVIALYYLIDTNVLQKYIESSEAKAIRASGIMRVLGACLSVCLIFSLVVVPNPEIQAEQFDKEVFLQIKRETDTTGSRDLFILSRGVPLSQSYTLLECPDFGIYSDCVTDNGWSAMFPYMHDKLEEFGYRNSPYECMVNCDHVYFLGPEYGEDRLEFIRRHYVSNVDVSLVYTNDELNSYSVTAPMHEKERRDICRWSITDTELRSGKESFWMIRGKAEGCNESSSYFMKLNDDSREYFYEIRVDGNEFSFGVPCRSWKELGECRATIYERNGCTVIEDDDEVNIGGSLRSSD